MRRNGIGGPGYNTQRQKSRRANNKVSFLLFFFFFISLIKSRRLPVIIVVFFVSVAARTRRTDTHTQYMIFYWITLNAVSVREKTGKKVNKKPFGETGVHVL